RAQRSRPFPVSCCAAQRALLSFPTRRSSDLLALPWLPPRRSIGEAFDIQVSVGTGTVNVQSRPGETLLEAGLRAGVALPYECRRDRKSTRLNSSHVKISYAVFCLKKKKTKQT